MLKFLDASLQNWSLHLVIIHLSQKKNIKLQQFIQWKAFKISRIQYVSMLKQQHQGEIPLKQMTPSNLPTHIHSFIVTVTMSLLSFKRNRELYSFSAYQDHCSVQFGKKKNSIKTETVKSNLFQAVLEVEAELHIPESCQNILQLCPRGQMGALPAVQSVQHTKNLFWHRASWEGGTGDKTMKTGSSWDNCS